MGWPTKFQEDRHKRERIVSKRNGTPVCGGIASCMELARIIGKGKLPCLQGVEMRGFQYEIHGSSIEELREAQTLELEVGKELRRVCKPR